MLMHSLITCKPARYVQPAFRGMRRRIHRHPERMRSLQPSVWIGPGRLLICPGLEPSMIVRAVRFMTVYPVSIFVLSKHLVVVANPTRHTLDHTGWSSLELDRCSRCGRREPCRDAPLNTLDARCAPWRARRGSQTKGPERNGRVRWRAALNESCRAAHLRHFWLDRSGSQSQSSKHWRC